MQGMVKEAIVPTIVSCVSDITPSIAQTVAETMFPKVESLVNRVADRVCIVHAQVQELERRAVQSGGGSEGLDNLRDEFLALRSRLKEVEASISSMAHTTRQVSRSPVRTSGSGPSSSAVVCKFGFDCNRLHCSFRHSDGRKIDGKQPQRIEPAAKPIDYSRFDVINAALDTEELFGHLSGAMGLPPDPEEDDIPSSILVVDPVVSHGLPPEPDID
jgi:hypothetical protein